MKSSFHNILFLQFNCLTYHIWKKLLIFKRLENPENN
jgi:hypothetical protein